MRNLLTVLACSMLVALTGCVSGSKGASQDNELSIPAPIINVPPPQVVDTEELKKEIRTSSADVQREVQASSNATQNQLSGAINASVSKVAEKLVGAEAHLSELLKVQAEITNSANLNASAKLDAMVELKARLEAHMTNVVDVRNEIRADLKELVKLQADMNAQLNANAQGQVGWGNEMRNEMKSIKETITATAGRDVNMLPQSAVDVITNMAYGLIGIISILAALSAIVISMAYRHENQKAKAKADLEKAESERLYGILLRAMGEMPQQKAAEFDREIRARPVNGG